MSTDYTPPPVRFRLFEDGELILELLASEWYDTATPHSWCSNKLRDVRDRLRGRQRPITVVTVDDGQEEVLQTPDDLRDWIGRRFSAPGTGFVADLF